MFSRNPILVIAIISLVILFGCVQEQDTGNAKPGTENASASSPSKKNESKPLEVPKCTDSDAENSFKPGTVSFNSTSFDDVCVNSTIVQEQVCQGNKPSTKQIECPAGYLCKKGMCYVTEQRCKDSDGGTNYNATGTVTYDGEEFTDVCTTGNLKEYYCQNDKPENSITSCPKQNHCVEGHCEYWPPTCTEEKGSTKLDMHTGFVELKENFCKDLGTLVTNKCIGANISIQETKCASTEWCSNETKTCETRTCEEFGVGNAPDKDNAGWVIYGPDIYVDKCSSDTVVTDYYCEDGIVKSAALGCGNGYYVTYSCKTNVRDIYNSQTDKYYALSIAYCG